MRGGQVVAELPLEGQEVRGHHGAHRVQAEVLRTARARAVAVEAGERLGAAELQRSAEHVPLVPRVRTGHGSSDVRVVEVPRIGGRPPTQERTRVGRAPQREAARAQDARPSRTWYRWPWPAAWSTRSSTGATAPRCNGATAQRRDGATAQRRDERPAPAPDPVGA